MVLNDDTTALKCYASTSFLVRQKLFEILMFIKVFMIHLNCERKMIATACRSMNYKEERACNNNNKNE